MDFSPRTAIKLGGAVGGLLVLVMIGASSYFVVNEGELGVLTRNGAFVGTQKPGLGWKVPILDTVTDMEIRNMALQFDVHVYSLDTQQYTAAITVNYDLEPSAVEQIYKREGVSYAERRLKPLVETQMKEIAGKFTAQRTIQERDIFGAKVRDAVRDNAKRYNISVTEVQVQNIDFTEQFEKAIENAMLAKAKVTEEENILQQKKVQAETKVVEATAGANAAREVAKGQADAKVTQAKAEATRIAEIGQAEADAIQKKANALRDNPELASYTYALASMNWDGKLPTQFIPGSTLPILNVAPNNSTPALGTTASVAK
jgi:regulator of protease activity HflC (stomatin/prohibitin superfamily)